MAWTQQGSLKGPQGDAGTTGSPGRGITSAVLNGSDELVLTFTDTTTQNLGVIVGIDGTDGADGAAGADGKSVTIVDSVANAAALPTGLTGADAGKGYITEDDGHLHVWSGTVFNDVGEIRGPQGVPGTDGAEGAKGDTGDTGPRGASWFSGHGSPGVVSGSQPGDFYLDLDTGAVWALS